MAYQPNDKNREKKMKELSEKRHDADSHNSPGCGCGEIEKGGSPGLQPLSISHVKPEYGETDIPCCGPRPGPPCSPYDRPGYRMWHFVAGFVETPVGIVPQITTSLSRRDIAGTLRARLGFSRDRYRVAPGLYSVGQPGEDSPVLVSANYKLSFDSLRRELAATDAWILVLDTHGVNVWCAAGKKTFSSEELIFRSNSVGLEKLVSHRELIVPQLGAPGISSQAVKKGCGFKVVWGPIRARDLREFITNGYNAEAGMRQVTFALGERIVLIPVELSLIMKPSVAILLAVFVLSGISPDFFSFSAAWFRGINGTTAYLLGILAGAVAVPIFLPWFPMRRFYMKGILSGVVAGIFVILGLGGDISRLESLTLFLFTSAVSSYAAMNFTGATPFTSPSGVEKEMRQGIPIQIVTVAAAVIAWVAAPFVG